MQGAKGEMGRCGKRLWQIKTYIETFENNTKVQCIFSRE